MVFVVLFQNQQNNENHEGSFFFLKPIFLILSIFLLKKMDSFYQFFYFFSLKYVQQVHAFQVTCFAPVSLPVLCVLGQSYFRARASGDTHLPSWVQDWQRPVHRRKPVNMHHCKYVLGLYSDRVRLQGAQCL